MASMTTREKAHRLLDELSDEDLIVEYRRLRAALDDGRELDDGDDLDRFSARASLGVLRHMTEEEEAAGFSWEKYR